jgi:endonuclease IV
MIRQYSQKRTMLGVHSTKLGDVIPQKARTLAQAVERDCEAFGFNAAQIYTHGPRSDRRNNYDAKELLEVSRDYEIDLYVHGPYFATKIWKWEDEEEIAEYVEPMFEAGGEIKAKGWVLHVTKQPPENLVRIVEIITPIARKHKVPLLLEMVAVKPDRQDHAPENAASYFTSEDINYVTDLLPSSKWWGWCIDTAHLWAGNVDVRSRDDMTNWLDAIREKDRIYLIHLNGSENALGSGKDMHAAPGGELDVIWRGMKFDDTGLAAMVEFAHRQEIALIMEMKRRKTGTEEKAVSRVARKIFRYFNYVDLLKLRHRSKVDKKIEK